MIWQLLMKIASSLFYFALHVTPAGSFPPPLKAKEETALLERMKNGDAEARNKLIEHNLRLVAHIVKKYYSAASEQEDLISIGTIGLIKGVTSFKAEKGIRLATYAARCIDNEILMHFRALKKTAQDVYISDPIDTDKDGNTLTLIDIIADDTDIAEQIDIKLKLQKLKTIINHALDEREKTIICYRYGIGGCKELTQHEIAHRLGISRSYVSRIEKAALIKLRQLF
ncbi:MAG: RNA polymerase sporulation sigma factor SigK [Acutalibacteraceae bacterium]|nr:RNA polymerase sporulation sigma factor SigK [Acutalibacteraceae bacterium]